MTSASKLMDLCNVIDEGRTLPTMAQIENDLKKLSDFFVDVTIEEDEAFAKIKPAQIQNLKTRISALPNLQHALVGFEGDIVTFEAVHSSAEDAAEDAAEELDEE